MTDLFPLAINCRITDIAACSLTSRVLSLHARPYLFKQLCIQEEDYVLRLLDLMNANPEICRWIEDILIDAGLADVDDTHPLARWFGGDLAAELLSKLRNVRILRVMHLHGGPEGHFTSMITSVWSPLSELDSLVRLQIDHCDLLSLCIATALFAYSFPNLQYLSMSSVTFSEEDPEIKSEQPQLIAPDSSALIPLLALRSLEHIGGALVSSIAVPRILMSFKCTCLTRLVVGPHLSWCTAEPPYAYAHIQSFLHHAPTLRELHLTGCDSIGRRHIALSLSMNGELQHLVFDYTDFLAGVEAENDGLWILRTRASLRDPVSLECLIITGDLTGRNDRAWDALDATLSEDRFTCEIGHRRTLALKHRGHASVPRSAYAELDPEFLEGVMPQARRLGWFNLEWEFAK